MLFRPFCSSSAKTFFDDGYGARMVGAHFIVVLVPCASRAEFSGDDGLGSHRLYCIPIQLFVFGNLASVCTTNVQGGGYSRSSVITYYAAVMFIWLTTQRIPAAGSRIASNLWPKPVMQRQVVVIAANAAWNLVNFRSGLIAGLIANGYAVVAAAPPDAKAETALKALGARFAPVPIDSKGVSPARDLATLLAFRRLLLAERPPAFLAIR
jgi:hypothetical protein